MTSLILNCFIIKQNIVNVTDLLSNIYLILISFDFYRNLSNLDFIYNKIERIENKIRAVFF